MKKFDRIYRPESLFWAISIVLLIVAIFAVMPHYYYQILKWVVCVSAVFTLSFCRKKQYFNFISIVYFIAAVIYNPLAPFHFGSEMWKVINIVTLIPYAYALGWIELD